MQPSLGSLSVKVSEESSLWTARILVSTVFTDGCGLTSSPELCLSNHLSEQIRNYTSLINPFFRCSFFLRHCFPLCPRWLQSFARRHPLGLWRAHTGAALSSS